MFNVSYLNVAYVLEMKKIAEADYDDSITLQVYFAYFTSIDLH